MSKEQPQYVKLSRYTLLKLIEIVEKSTADIELGDQSKTLYMPGFWMYRLDNNYKIRMSDLDDKDLKTVFETCKIVAEANRAILNYKQNKTEEQFTETHHALGNLLVRAVKNQSFTALYHLITEYGAPVTYKEGIYLADAVKTKNWYGAPIEALVTSGRLNTFLQDRYAAYNLLKAVEELGRGDLIKYIVTNDTRERRGTSKAYTTFLYKLIIDPLKCKKGLAKYLLNQIQYTAESLSKVLENVSVSLELQTNGKTVDFNFDIRCVSMVVDKLYEMDREVANSILRKLIYAKESKYLYSVMMKRLQLQHDKDEYIEMIRIALYRPKFNNRTILNLYKDGVLEKGLLHYFDRKTLSTFIRKINDSDPETRNIELRDMLIKVLKDLPK